MSAVDEIAAYLAHLKTSGNRIDQIIFDELPNGEGMSATNELKPCPFCGGKALVIRDYCTSDNACVFEDFYVSHWCKLLPTRMVTKKFATEDEAIAAWNRRAK